MQSKFRKLMAICLAATLFVTYIATGLTTVALGSTNLLANLTLSDTTGVTMDAANNGFTVVSSNSETPIYFNDVKLEKNSTYEYSFDITFHTDPGSQLPRFALRDGGQWFNFIGAWGQQGRLNDTNDINPFIGLLSLSLTADTTYNFKFELEPTRARLLIDGVAQVNTAGNTDTNGWVTLPAVVDGKIGLDTFGGVNLTMSNLSLIKTVQGSSIDPKDVIAAIDAIGTVNAYSRAAIETARKMYDELSAEDQALVTNASALTAAETAFAKLNLLANLSVSSSTNAVVDATTNSVKITCGDSPVYFNNLTLEKDSTYVYEFDMIYDGGYNATFPWLILRDGGQYINAGAYGCLRVCESLNFDAFKANVSMSATNGVPVAFKILMEPERVKVYINGSEVAFGDNVTGAPYADNWVPLSAVEDGKIGVTGGNPGFTYTLSNISLTNADSIVTDPAVAAVIAAIDAIGTVNAYSRAAIETARDAYEALTTEQQAQVTNTAALTAAEEAFASMNLLANLSVSSSTNAVVDETTNSVKITCSDSPVYFNNLTLKKDSTYVYEFDMIYDGGYNATFPWLILRDGGQYINAGAYGCLRVCESLNFDVFKANVAMSATNGVPVAFKILMEPERVKVYINGSEVAFGDNVTGAPYADNWVPLSAVENGKIGVTGGNPGFTYTLSNISLTKADSIVTDPAVTAVIAAIDAIGTVTTASKAAIEQAEAAYAALTNNQKIMVTNYDTLTAARITYNNAVKAAEVDALIDAIGTVDAGSEAAIKAAREAYNALTDDQKTMVSKITTLIKAEKVFAALGGTKDVYYYYPTTDDLMGANYWPSNVMQSNISTGGIHYKWYNAGTDWRTGLNIPLKLDGLHLTLGNISFTSESKQFAIYLADKDADEGYTASSKAPLIFVFNCESGELKVTSESNPNAGVTIIRTDALKAENLVGKQVELKISANGDGSYTVNMLGETGTITKAMMDAAVAFTNYDKAFLTLCPWNWAATAQVEFDLLAVHGGESVCSDTLTNAQLAAINAVIAKIDAIGEVTKDSETTIVAARAAYEALSTIEKNFVGNYKDLENAEWKLQSIKAEAGIEYKDKHYYRPSADQTMGTNYWTNNLFISNLAEGGIHFEWNMTGTDWRMGINKKMTLDGLHLVFSNLKYSSANKRFVVYIHDLRDGAEDWGAGYASYGNIPLAIVFDGNKGLVKVCSEQVADPTGIVLIESRALLAENMEGKDFDLKITANGDGTYTLSVMGMEATLTKEIMNAAEGLTEYEEVYVTLCPWDWNTSTVMKLDLIAMHGGQEICADEVTDEVLATINSTIETIKAIFNEKGQITLASYENIKKARELYEALDDYVKGIVENYQDLVDAEEIFEIVKAIDGIGTVTLDKAKVINLINEMYKDLDAYKRPMVGNYLVLGDALLDLYLLQRGEKEEDIGPNDSDSNNPTGDGATSPVTGESMLSLILALVLAIVAGGLLVYKHKRKNTKAL